MVDYVIPCEPGRMNHRGGGLGIPAKPDEPAEPVGKPAREPIPPQAEGHDGDIQQV